MDRPLRVAVLTYRGNPHSGGQGVYVRHLTTALVRGGHEVEVLSGPPYPALDPAVRLQGFPSLELYRPDDPFRPIRPSRGPVDRLEWLMARTGSYPEPLTFSLRAARWFGAHAHRFDIVHDNQCLGYGVLAMNRRVPAIVTMHHPMTVDRRLDLERIPHALTRLVSRRWYSFIRMQVRVARRLPIITVSEASRRDLVSEMGLRSERITVVPVGVDHELFSPTPADGRVPGRILVISSADSTLKGVAVMMEALAKVRTERPAHLMLVGRVSPDGLARRAARTFGVEDAVTFAGVVDSEQLSRFYAEACVAVVPSLYEGFSLPAVQAMSSGLPLVATTGGALPEVAGPDGEAALLVPPGNADALAAAVSRVLADPALGVRLGRAGRERVLGRFTWERTAEATIDRYRAVIASRRAT